VFMGAGWRFRARRYRKTVADSGATPKTGCGPWPKRSPIRRRVFVAFDDAAHPPPPRPSAPASVSRGLAHCSPPLTAGAACRQVLTSTGWPRRSIWRAYGDHRVGALAARIPRREEAVQPLRCVLARRAHREVSSTCPAGRRGDTP
jgi:hypothetical protein